MLPVQVNAEDNLFQDGTNCEYIAKHYSKVYSTDVYIIVPLKNNGALDMGAYTGHIFNSKIINNKRIYINFDGSHTDIFTSEQQVKDWYKELNNKNSEIYNTQHTPFHMIWHYD